MEGLGKCVIRPIVRIVNPGITSHIAQWANKPLQPDKLFLLHTGTNTGTNRYHGYQPPLV